MTTNSTGGKRRIGPPRLCQFQHPPFPQRDAAVHAGGLVRERKADKVLAYLEAVQSGVYA
jgi:hypothetical protein